MMSNGSEGDGFSSRSKFWLTTVTILIFLIIVGTFLVNWLVDRYLTVSGIENQLSTAISRSVSIDSYNFSIWEGIELTGIRISEYPDESAGTWLKARSVFLKPRWLPLLRGNVIISKAVVDSPDIRVIRTRGGTWNLTRGFHSDSNHSNPENDRDSGSEQPATTTSSQGTESAGNVQLTVDRLELRNGSVEFIDQLKSKTLNVQFDGLRVENFSLNRGFKLGIESLRYPSGSLNGTVQWDRENNRITITETELKSISYDSVREYLSAYIPETINLRNASVGAVIDHAVVSPTDVSFDGSIDLRSFQGSMFGFDPFPVNQAFFEGTIETGTSRDGISIRAETLGWNQIRTEGKSSLTVSSPWNRPRVNGRVQLGSLSLQRLLKESSRFGFDPIPAGYKTEGTLSKLELAFSGQFPDLKPEGSVRLNDLKIERDAFNEPIELSAVDLNLKGDRLSFQGSVKGRTINIKGSVAPYRTLNTATINGTISGSRLSISELMDRGRPFLPGTIKNYQVKGQLRSINVNVEGPAISPSQWDYNAEGSLDKTRVSIPRRSEPLNLSTASFKLDPRAVDFDVKWSEFGGKGTLKGTVNQYRSKQNRTFDVSFDGQRLAMEPIVKLARHLGIGEVKNMKLVGTLSELQGNVSGTVEDPDYQADVSFENTRIESTHLPMPLELKEGSIDLSKHSLNGSVEFQNFGGNGSLNGTVNRYRTPEQARFDLSFAGSNFNMKPIVDGAGTLGIQLDSDIVPEGDLKKVEGTLSGTINEPDYRVDLVIENTRVKSGRIPGTPEFPSGSIQVKPGEITGSIQFRHFGGRGRIEGDVSNYRTPARSSFDLSISGQALQTGDILSTLNTIEAVRVPPEFDVTGPLNELDLKLGGTVSKPSYSGSVTFRNLSLKTPYVDRKFSLHSTGINFNTKSINGSIRTDGLGGPLNIDGSISNYSEFPNSSLRLRLSGRGITLDGLQSISSQLNLMNQRDLKVAGTLNELKASVTGPALKPAISVSGRVRNGSLSSGQFPGKLESINGKISYQNEKVKVDGITGTYQGRPFEVTASVPVPFEESSNIQVRGTVDRLDLKTIETFIPPDRLPAGVNADGFISLKNFRASGTVNNLQMDGEMNLDQVSATVPRIDGKVTDINGTINFDQRSGRIRSLSGQWKGKKIVADGSVQFGTNQGLDLTIKPDPVSISFLKNNISGFPEFPEGWKPSGTIEGLVLLKGKFDKPKVSGGIRSPELQLGTLKGTSVKGRFDYSGGQLIADQVSMNVLGGRAEGQLTFQFNSGRSMMEGNAQISGIGLGEVFRTFAAQGHRSEGAVHGTIRFDGPVGKWTQFNGNLRAKGDTIIFRDVDVFRQMALVLRAGVGDVIGLSSEDVLRATSWYRDVDVHLDVTKGKGTIRTFRADNPQMTVRASGNIWLNSNLDASVRLVPKQPFFRRVTKSWARSVLEAGLPTITVSGTMFSPTFNRSKFTKKLTERFIEARVGSELREKGSEILRNLFD